MVRDLEEIKKEKLEEMREKMQGDSKKQEEMKKRTEALKKNLLRRYLTKDAIQRLGRVRIAHPNLAKRAEMAILQSVRMSGKKKKINEKELKEILRRLS